MEDFRRRRLHDWNSRRSSYYSVRRKGITSHQPDNPVRNISIDVPGGSKFAEVSRRDMLKLSMLSLDGLSDISSINTGSPFEFESWNAQILGDILYHFTSFLQSKFEVVDAYGSEGEGRALSSEKCFVIYFNQRCEHLITTGEGLKPRLFHYSRLRKLVLRSNGGDEISSVVIDEFDADTDEYLYTSSLLDNYLASAYVLNPNNEGKFLKDIDPIIIVGLFLINE